MAQNPYGQGYIGAYAVDLLAEGCTVKADAPFITTPQTARFIDSGTLLISAANIDSYADDLKKLTGVSGAIEKRLNDLGVFHYEQIAGLGATDAKKESVATAIKPVTENVFYKSDYEFTKDAEKQLVADEAEAFATAVGEGIVLLRNEGAALPLDPADGKVVAFGNATQYMTGFDAAMTGAGSILRL